MIPSARIPLAAIGTTTDKAMNTALLTKLWYITTAKKHPKTIEAIRKRNPAQASAISKVPSGISIINPSEKTGMWSDCSPAMLIWAVIFCSVGTRKAPLGTRKNRKSSGASSNQKTRGPSATSSTTSNIADQQKLAGFLDVENGGDQPQRRRAKASATNGHRIGLGDTDAMTQRRSHSRKPTSGTIRKQ